MRKRAEQVHRPCERMTKRALGSPFPPMLLALADEVIA
jgi:hypothetical protein